jgi:hypothetical protein
MLSPRISEYTGGQRRHHLLAPHQLEVGVVHKQPRHAGLRRSDVSFVSRSPASSASAFGATADAGHGAAQANRLAAVAIDRAAAATTTGNQTIRRAASIGAAPRTIGT